MRHFQFAPIILAMAIGCNVTCSKTVNYYGTLPPIAAKSGVVDVVERVSPSVVMILNTSVEPKNPIDFLDPESIIQGILPLKPRQAVVSGSGYFVTSHGDIVTNFHVVEPYFKGGTSTLTVKTMDGKKYPANLIAGDAELDIAVIRVGLNGTPAVVFGDSSRLKSGMQVFAVGAPYGFPYSVTQGIVSNPLRKPFWGLQEFVQTDAAINPGNSGGPLFNLDGEVIAMNTLGIRGGESMALSITSNMVKASIPGLAAGITPDRGFLGAVVSVPKSVPIETEDTTGVEVIGVVGSGPAARCGIRSGDVIIRVGESGTISNCVELLSVVSSHRRGETLIVHYRRGLVVLSARVTLDDRASLFGHTNRDGFV